MSNALNSERGDDDRIILSLLNSVENDGFQSQRHIAADLGIALGLVNAYLKRCVRKGLVKVSTAPARRYAYYLTPHGFTEKSRLTVEYLSSSFSFFRQAKSNCAEVFGVAQARNFHNLVLIGKSDLAEVAILSAADGGVSIVAVVDEEADNAPFLGREVFSSCDKVAVPFDAVVITDLRNARKSFDEAKRHLGAHRVFAPKLLGLSALTAEKGQS